MSTIRSRSSRWSSYRPGLEPLESRYTPDCSLSYGNGLLTILGDSTANTISITDEGPAGLNVSYDGHTAHFSQVTRLRVNTGAGIDDVQYRNLVPGTRLQEVTMDLGTGNDKSSLQVSGVMGPNHLAFNLNLGDGNDLCSIRYGGLSDPSSVVQDGSVRFAVNLGAGNDTCDVRSNQAETLSLPIIHGNIQADQGDDFVQILIGLLPPAQEVSFDVSLGDGNDVFLAKSQTGGATLAGTLRLDVDGGTGNDRLNVDLAFSSPVLPTLPPPRMALNLLGGTGNDDLRGKVRENGHGLRAADLMVHLDGGYGDDLLSLLVDAPTTGAILDLLIDGGPGYDRGFAGPNVGVIRCEELLGGPPSDV